MKICSLCVKKALVLALLVPGSSLTPNQRPLTSAPESSTTNIPFAQKAKQWVAAGLVGASLALTTNAAPASAVTKEPTKIEVTVETDYLVRALNTFEGDMRKTMAAMVRAPSSSISIDPPEEARDEVLRALYPYNQPEEYAEQAAWVGVSVEKEKTIVDTLMEKKFSVDIPSAEEGLPELKLELSPLDIGIAAAVVLAVPAAYGSYQEEQEEEKILADQKAAIKAKKAALEQKNAAAMQAKLKSQTSGRAAPKGPKGAARKTQPVTEYTNGAPASAPVTHDSSFSVNARISTDTDGDFTLSLDEATINELESAIGEMLPGANKIVVKGTLEAESEKHFE